MCSLPFTLWPKSHWDYYSELFYSIHSVPGAWCEYTLCFPKAATSLHVLTGYSCFSSPYSAHEQSSPSTWETFLYLNHRRHWTLPQTLSGFAVPGVLAPGISLVNYLGGDFIPYLFLNENYFAKDTADFVDTFVLGTFLTYLSVCVLGNLGGE